jgi:formylglycine-generating enzyme required for sulfatase activity
MGAFGLRGGTHLTSTGEEVSALDVFRDCEACPEMIVLPLGSFQMGSTVEEANAARMRFLTNMNADLAKFSRELRQALLDIGVDPDDPEEGLRRYYASGNVEREEDPQYFANPFLHEVPAHRVTIDMPIAMGRNEVTREEWAACVADGGCEQGLRAMPRAAWHACQGTADCAMTPDDRVRFRLPEGPWATHPRSPMTGMTYDEMTDYTSWLNERVGAEVYRVPTEAEWEYAARAGATTRYAQGDTLTLDQANFLVYRADLVDGEYVWSYDFGSAKELLPVDALDAANAWGLRHMSGNASERTSSCGDGPHRGLATSSAYLAADAERTDCKLSEKGGMYDGHVELARPARRVAISRDHWNPSMGFRVIRDLTPAAGSPD